MVIAGQLYKVRRELYVYKYLLNEYVRGDRALVWLHQFQDWQWIKAGKQKVKKIIN